MVQLVVQWSEKLSRCCFLGPVMESALPWYADRAGIQIIVLNILIPVGTSHCIGLSAVIAEQFLQQPEASPLFLLLKPMYRMC